FPAGPGLVHSPTQHPRAFTGARASHPPAATAAAQEAGQQPFRPLSCSWVDASSFQLALLCGSERFVGDDPQMRGCHALDLATIVRTADPSPSRRVAHHPHSIPDNDPCVNLALENSVSTPRVTVDR